MWQQNCAEFDRDLETCKHKIYETLNSTDFTNADESFPNQSVAGISKKNKQKTV